MSDVRIFLTLRQTPPFRLSSYWFLITSLHKLAWSKTRKFFPNRMTSLLESYEQSSSYDLILFSSYSKVTCGESIMIVYPTYSESNLSLSFLYSMSDEIQQKKFFFIRFDYTIQCKKVFLLLADLIAYILFSPFYFLPFLPLKKSAECG